ncbi:MAG: energy-coupling factor transporter transmembrane protein EcfT [Coriobacteriia bacterium]|nr:energy-coupling factor transporter transmembrane protein EcfT [Coriobacteriia bacterium]
MAAAHPTITIGSYLPGSSVLHRADPRTKIICALVLMVALFITNWWSPVLVALVLVAVLAGLARIPLGYLLRALRPVLIILVFTLAVNAVAFSPLRFSLAGLERGGLFALRIVAIMLLSTLVTLTTSPVALTDGLTLLAGPLRRLKVPVDDLAMMLSIALRFIPTIMTEAQTIIKAQTARGAQFNSGPLLKRLRAWTVILIPLLIQLFRRADTLALAMEARCYTGVGRTRLRILKLRAGDTATMAGAVLVLAGLITARVLIR